MRSSEECLCPPGTVCTAKRRFWKDGLCDTCRWRHTRTPGSVPNTAYSREGWKQLFDLPLVRYAPRPLKIRTRVIPIILGQIRKHHLPEQFPEVDAWAVPIHKVMNLKGRFRSHDLKDYLGLAKDKTLILSTVAPDEFMEVLWDKRAELDYAPQGVDYWFPAHFSIYDNDGKCFQIFNARRQQVHAIQMRSHFVWFRLGENIPVEFLEPIRGASSVLISCQQMYSSRNQAILRRELDIADAWFPPSTTFFFIGKPRGGLQKLKHRACRFDYRWIMLALHGRNARNEPDRKLPIRELLIRNLRHFLKELP